MFLSVLLFNGIGNPKLKGRGLQTPTSRVQAQFSRIENGKTDPAFSTIEKVARALGVGLAELVNADDAFTEVNSYDKSVIEKMALVDQLEEKEKSAFFSILDALVSKKRLKDSLSHALNMA